MSARSIGIALIVIGVLGLIFSLLLDFIGIGKYPGIGTSQLLGAALGVIVAIVGIILVARKEKPKE